MLDGSVKGGDRGLGASRDVEPVIRVPVNRIVELLLFISFLKLTILPICFNRVYISFSLTHILPTFHFLGTLQSFPITLSL